MNSIGYASIRPGQYHVAVGNDKIGTVRGDYVIGFEAFAINGRQIRGTFATPEQAAEVLALEVSLSDLGLPPFRGHGLCGFLDPIAQLL